MGLRPSPKAQAASDVGAADGSHVFRDFESSRIVAIRHAIAANPRPYSILFLLAVFLWTIGMSAGTALRGDDSLAVNLTPHVAHFTVILGVFLYPWRLLPLALAAYLAVFLYQFYQPFTGGMQWGDLPGMSAGRMAALFGINLVSGVATGIFLRLSLMALRGRLRPHMLDLCLCAIAFFSIIATSFLQFGAMLWLATTLPEAARAAWGFTDDYTIAALRRIARSGVVLSVFLLLTVEYPRRDQIGRTILLACLFPLLALAQSYGFVLHPTIDTVLLAILLTMLVPVRVAVAACTAGVAAYAALTGNFLDDRLLGDAHQIVLVHYSNIGLVIVNLIFAVRSYAAHVLAEKDASIRKLSRARDFAGVGLFAANSDARRFRLDAASQRILGLPAEGPLADFVAVFGTGGPLVEALASQTGHSTTLTLPAQRDGERVVLRIWVWAETTPTGARAAYGLIIDITDAEEREARLREALDTLSLREERQRQLFSIISHELRTPASVLSMLIEDLPEDGTTPRLRQLREARDQLMSVLDDMRQTVNPEKNLPIRRVSYVPADLAEGIRNAMDLTARQNDIRIDLSLGARAGKPRTGDVVRVRQALTNLVRNAILHSGGRSVRISFAVLPAGEDGIPVTEWRVQDDGIGLQPHEVERVFEPFVRGGPDARKRADGSGLGLYIARSAMVMLGGTLDHYQPAEGGTGFVIRVPEAEAKPIAPTESPARNLDMPDRPWTVVLAEDNPLVAEITRARLERIRATVRVAGDGRQALALVGAEQPDIVITDLFMPELDGDDLARRLRCGGYDRPIVGLTAAVVGEEMDRFRMAGVNVVMKKPLDFERLVSFLRDGFPEPEAESGQAPSA
ncbi:MAG: hypothetical protein RIR62_464 [Pseudomonadota bacterium]